MKTVKLFKISHFLKLNGVFLVLFLVGISLQYCSKTSPLEQRAHQFLLAYYINVDLERALAMSIGLSARKIKKEIQLGGGQATPEQLKQRKISFTKTNPHLSSNDKSPNNPTDRRELFYQLEIKAGQEEFKRLVRLTLVSVALENQSEWKISNFVEQEI